jgi:hypothetical protein
MVDHTEYSVAFLRGGGMVMVLASMLQWVAEGKIFVFSNCWPTITD